MKRNIFLIFVLLLLVCSILSAQPTINGEITLQAYQTYIERSPVQGGGYEYNYGTYGIGFSTSDSKLFRSYHTFNVSSIPSNSTITEVKLEYYTGTTQSYNFKVTQPSSVTSNLGTTFESIGNSSTKESGLAYTQVAQQIISNSIKSSLQSALSSGVLYLGALSHTESGSNSANYVTLKLHVKYTRPATQITLTAKNDMNGYSGGQIKAGWGSSNPKQTRTSPYTFNPYETESVNLEAIDNQTYNSYNWIFNDSEAVLSISDWRKGSGSYLTFVSENYQINFTASASENNYSYVNYLKKKCNIIFSNQFSGTSEGGQMKVNGGTVAAPTSAYTVVEQNAINAEANWEYSFNGIRYDFQYWQNETGGRTKTFYPGAHKNYVAVYRGTPIFGDANFRNLRFNTYSPLVERRVVLTWDEHPHTGVTQYQIWRHTKYNGVISDPVLRATVNRGTTTWTDIDFNIGPQGDDYQLFYDVRAYYSLEGTYSPENFLMCYGSDAQINKEGVEETNGELIVKEYSISNFPNPFNPSTTINYQLPVRGHVTIKVYDMLGKEVAELVNETKEMGIYNAEFSGSGLSSGVYVYTINVDALSENGQNYTASKKMLMMK